jgi:hypothetical protein
LEVGNVDEEKKWNTEIEVYLSTRTRGGVDGVRKRIIFPLALISTRGHNVIHADDSRTLDRSMKLNGLLVVALC